MVLLAKCATQMNSGTIGAVDIEVKRNAFGRQVNSFETDISIPVLGAKPFHAVFIRAPIITKAGPEVKILLQLGDGTSVAAR